MGRPYTFEGKKGYSSPLHTHTIVGASFCVTDGIIGLHVPVIEPMAEYSKYI